MTSSPARYIVAGYPERMINIRHFFLAPFAGTSPYERGIKLIGATPHCVTDQLNTKPVMNQDVAYVAH